MLFPGGLLTNLYQNPAAPRKQGLNVCLRMMAHPKETQIGLPRVLKITANS